MCYHEECPYKCCQYNKYYDPEYPKLEWMNFPEFSYEINDCLKYLDV